MASFSRSPQRLSLTALLVPVLAVVGSDAQVSPAAVFEPELPTELPPVDAPLRVSPRENLFGVQVSENEDLLKASSLGCSNNNTCNPAFCRYANGPSNVPCSLGNATNITEAEMQKKVAGVSSKVCLQSQDRRCTSTALQAVFGRFPGVKAAYCNDEFMVLHATDLPNHGTSLDFIHTPPVKEGVASGGVYAEQCVLRDYFTQHYTFKWPLNPVLLPTSDGVVNNFDHFKLPSDTLYSLNGKTSLPAIGPSAVTVSGVPWIPSANHLGSLTWSSCEVDVCNAHAGPYGDYHYHGDPFGPQCMYSAADYSQIEAHPPLIGYGLDGVAIFGRYLSEAAPGFHTPLDDCGGHQHTGIGDAYLEDNTYHYHTFFQHMSMEVETMAINITTKLPAWSGRASYTAGANGPFMCWKGDISTIPNFWTAANPAHSAHTASYLANDLAAREDYQEVQPCRDTREVFLADGYTLPEVLLGVIYP